MRPTVMCEGEMKCDQLLHGWERYCATNCYMGGRGTVRPTVTWEGELKLD